MYGHIRNIWLQLPGMGGNEVMITEARRRHESDHGDYDFGELIFYSQLRRQGLTIAFRSAQLRCEGIIYMEFGDILCWCPQGHVWPLCGLCNKFHLPATGSCSHRNSIKHSKKKAWAAVAGADATRDYYFPGRMNRDI
jgi:hypothetical protein